MAKEFIEGKHFYLDGGRVVFTALYHLERGHCCHKNCRHCPYKELNTDNMEIKIKPLYHDVKLPVLGSEFAACYDVYAHSISFHPTKQNKRVVGLGFATEIPQGYKGIIVPRSNITKHDWVINNSMGIIDADYRGEWLVVFSAITYSNIIQFPYEVGDRIAQIYFEKVTPIEFNVVEELEESARGAGGFGSTGVSTINKKGNSL